MFQQLKSHNKGFSMVEVIVATLIFAIATAGMFATLSAIKQPAEESQDEITAAFLGKQILEELRKETDATTWDTGDLSPGTYPLPAIPIDGKSYTPTYTVVNDPNGTSARKVTLTIEW